MANSSDKDLMGIGRHCDFTDCHQLDFLPFKCDCCNKTFCVEHRTYTSHACPTAGKKESQVFVCPLCARAVKVLAGGDANAAFDRHCRTECDPANYDKVHRKERCPAPGCKERLNTVNSYTCKDCCATVCLRHRLPTDHQCPGRAPAAAAAAQSRFAALPAAFKGLFSSSSTSSKGGGSGSAPARKSLYPTAAEPARGAVGATAAAAGPASRGGANVAAQLQQYRSAQQGQQQQQQHSRATPPTPSPVVDLTGGTSSAGGLLPAQRQQGAGAGGEVCQQCGARFATVHQLIQHAERVHMDGWSSGRMQSGAGSGGTGGAAGAGQLERCPHCGRQFGDAVELVGHVTKEHAGSSKRESCVLC